ncbi:MAG: cysteine-rich CWC family protein [Bacteroidetes bacterium]|nr:cysteine-rich CWC family protein [Bacteroidota bacterium]
MNFQEKEICPRCYSKFECSKSKKCWCYEFDMPSDVLENISKKYDSCLCSKCTEDIINSKGINL